ncbi:hypothetical protein [Nocardia sp. NPDC051570]|uniref:hypothetical protein n=1 Tax=Nocardia sp. NPDC051570 TaxID=3364324 RepID=UPI0037AC5F42
MYNVTYNEVAHINDIDGFEITFPFDDRVGIVVTDPAKAPLTNYYMAWALAAPIYIEAVGDVDRAMIALVADELRFPGRGRCDHRVLAQHRRRSHRDPVCAGGESARVEGAAARRIVDLDGNEIGLQTPNTAFPERHLLRQG